MRIPFFPNSFYVKRTHFTGCRKKSWNWIINAFILWGLCFLLLKLVEEGKFHPPGTHFCFFFLIKRMAFSSLIFLVAFMGAFIMPLLSVFSLIKRTRIKDMTLKKKRLRQCVQISWRRNKQNTKAVFEFIIFFTLFFYCWNPRAFTELVFYFFMSLTHSSSNLKSN